MGPRPGGEPTGPKKPDTGVKEGSLYEMLDTVVEPETLQSFRDKVLKILERKAAILAELRKIIDHETFLKRLESFSIELENYFTETTWKINNLVSEIKKNQRIPGSKAAEDLIKKIKNLPYLDPEEDRDLINKLKAELAKLSQNSSQLEEPLNLVPRYQLALISEGGNTLEQYRRRVQAALERSDDKEQFEKKQLEDLVKELEGLVREISALEIMQVHPNRSSLVLSERKAYELRVEYDKLNYQAILISDGGKKLEQFKERVKAALERSDDKEQFEKKQLEDLVKELEGLVREISALEIMQVHPSPSSSLPPEIEACKLQAEYKRMIEMIEEAQIKLRLRKLRSST
jgi:primosomal protein N''